MPLQKPVQRAAAHPQQARSARLVSLDKLQRPDDVVAFYFEE
jgi:hypothetical protein